MESDRFYADLEPFDDFGEFAAFDAYTPVPDDWMAVTADVIGSTKAIGEGRYKAVNMVGAAVITACLRAAEGLDLPFVFGGDGGTVLAPARLRPEMRRAMAGLRALAARDYGLGLRAATIPVSRLRQDGTDLRVRKLRLSPGNHLAMFAGGGAARADAILKGTAPDDPDLIGADDAPPPDLEGLSCRWEPLRPRGGIALALIVEPAHGPAAGDALPDALAAIRDALADPIETHAPVSDAALRFRFPPRGLMMEARAAARGGPVAAAYAWSLFTAAMQALAERFGLKIGDYDQRRYRGELKTNTDFRKVEDGLRMVLDVTAEQADAIEAQLADRHRRGLLVYGLHAADEALMTCLVFSLEQSRHVHFVDAADGGFARAATRLKAQKAALPALVQS